MRILGIDPGSNVTGYGVVDTQLGGRASHVAHGTLRPARSAPLAGRLATIQAGLREVIHLHAPNLAVVEQVFVSASARSALVLGQARGAALAELGAAGIVVEELAPRQIKLAVAGSGAAGKAQVQAMVQRLLGLDRQPAQDAADALAAALCRAHQGRLAGAGARRGGRRSARGSRFVVRRGR